MVLCIIPARGGSKGVPQKNIRLLAGKPLIAHTIEAARSSPSVNRVIVSTDDTGIAAVAKEWGAEVPFMRPSDLALDTTPMLPVVEHAFRWFEREIGRCDIVVLLQPTSPFRPLHLVEEAIRPLTEKRWDMVLSLTPVKKHPYWMKTIHDGYVQPFLQMDDIPTRRQDLPPAYAISGSIYGWTRDALLRRQKGDCSGATQFSDEKVGAVLVDNIHAVDIDTELDFKFAEFLATDYLPKNK